MDRRARTPLELTEKAALLWLASTPPRNHWWHAPLYVDVRGLDRPVRQLRRERSDRSRVVAGASVGHVVAAD